MSAPASGPSAPEGSRRRAGWIALAAALLAYLPLVRRFDFVCDDAYISFRYARHLAEGRGLAFNPGEPPVEGFSNLLWVLAAALCERLGLEVTLAMRVLSVACGVALLALVTRFVARRAERPLAAALAAGLALATLPPFAVWSTGGLETSAFALALFAAFAALHPIDPALRPARGATWRAAAWLVVALLLRADGALWGLGLCAASALGAARGWLPERRVLARLALPLGVLLLAALALGAWRMAYFGDWIANTARAKAGLSPLRLERGLFYVGTALLSVPSLALLGAAPWLCGRQRASAPVDSAPVPGADPRRAWVRAALWFALFGAAYSVATGGDFMAFGRFLVPALAPLCAVLGDAVARARVARGWAALALVLATSLAAAFDRVPVPRAARAALHFRWNSDSWQSELEVWRGMRDRARQWSVQGRALALCTRPGESMIGYAIGAIGYHSELVLHDMFGLVDRDVGRRPVSGLRLSPGHDRLVGWEYFLPRRPTYFGSHLAPAGAPLDDGLGSGFATSPLAALIEIERCPLDPAQGFEPGLELRLFRFRLD